MKKVKNGLLYDTERSNTIYGYESGRIDSASYRSETLFKSPRGRFYLYRVGSQLIDAPYEHYGQYSEIRPLLTSEALQWCEDHDAPVEVILENFAIDYA